MTALRLAEHVAKTTDINGMLDSMSPQQFDEWCAKDLIEPIGGSRTIELLLAKVCQMVAGALGVELTISDLMPWCQPARERALSPRQSAAAITAALKMTVR